MKKAVSFIISLIICLSVFVLSTPVAFAASYSGSCGDNASWILDTTAGTLTISGSGETEDYSLSSTPSWDRYQNYIKSVVFDDGITGIGAYTFYNGGNGYKYRKLTSIDFGTVETIGEYAFRGCAAIDTLTNCDYVYSIGDHAFRGCSAIESITEFSGVEEIGTGAFCGCSSIESLILPTTVETIGAEAFENCSSAQNITLPVSVTAIGGRAFSDCGNVSLINYYSRSLSTVGGGIFDNTGVDSGLTLNIGSSVTKIPANLFENCTNLTTVQGGTGLSTLGDNAFAHTGITSFTVNSKLNSISYTAFADCQALTQFTVSSSNDSFSANEDGILLDKSGTQLVRYPGGKTDTSYVLPSGITTIVDGAFRECRYLKTFTSQSSVADIPDYCFANCHVLEKATFKTNTRTIGAYAFVNCPKLSQFTMTGVTHINNYAFSQCSSLTSFASWSNLRIIADFAFSDCGNLTNVTINSGVTSIGKYAFYNCANLASVTLASTVKTISEGAFLLSPSLTSVTIPSGVTTIDKYAFASCTALTSVTVPSSVTTIGSQAFGFKHKSGTTFEKISGFVLRCYSGSAAANYATSNSITKEFITDSADDDVIELTDIVDEEPSETKTTGSDFSLTSVLEKIDGLIESLIGSTLYTFIKQLFVVIIDNLTAPKN